MTLARKMLNIAPNFAIAKFSLAWGKMMRVVFVVLLVAVLSACSAAGPVFTEVRPSTSNKSLVYIYRPKAFAMGGRTAAIAMDNKPIADLSNNGYVVVSVDPGVHRFSESWTKWVADDQALQDPIAITVTAAPGSVHFIRLASTSSLNDYLLRIQWELSEVDAVDAKQQISNCRLQQ